MKTLDRYILTQQIPPFGFGLAVVIFILILDFLYKNLDMLLGKGIPLSVSFQLILLSIGWMIVLAIPMAVLIAVLISFMRLASDREIVAMRSAGLNLLRIARPVLIASTLLSVLLIPINNHLVPETNHRLANLLAAIHKKKPAIQLRDGIFMNDIKGYSILVHKVKGRKLEGITISRFQPGKPAQTIRAKQGEMYFADDGVTLVLRLKNGEIHDVDEKDPKRYLRVVFSEHSINIPDAGSKLEITERRYRGDREMSIPMMKSEIVKQMQSIRSAESETESILYQSAEILSNLRSFCQSDSIGYHPPKMGPYIERSIETLGRIKFRVDSSERRIRALRVEVHKKIAISFACLVFTVIGIPIAVAAKEGGTSAGIAISTGFFAIYYVFLTTGEKLADRGYLHPVLSMWAANIILGIAGVYIFYRENNQLPLLPFSVRTSRGGNLSEYSGSIHCI